MADDKKKTISGRYGEIVRSHKSRNVPSKAEDRARDYYEQKKGELDYYSQQVEDLSNMRAGQIQDVDQHLIDISEAYVGKRAAETELPSATSAYAKEVHAREKTAHKMLQSKMLTATSRAGVHDEINIHRHNLSFAERQALVASMGDKPIGSVEERVRSGRESIEVRRTQLQEMTAKLRPGEDVSHIEKMAHRLDAATRAQGRREATLDEMRKSGRDIDSIYRGTQKAAKKAEGYLSSKELERDVRSGAVKSSDIETRLGVAAKTLQEAAAEFKKGSEEGAKNLSELAAAASKASEEFTFLKKAQEEIRRQDGGGGDWGNRIKKVAGYMQVTSGLLNAGAQVYRQWAVDQEIERSGFRGSLMGIANQRFDDARAAARGDMQALMRLEKYSKSAAFGSDISRKTEGAATAEAAGSILSAGADILTGAVSGYASGRAVGAVVGALSTGAPGVVKASGDISRLHSGAVPAEAFLQGEEVKRFELTAMDYQTAAVRQTAVDFARKTWRTSAGSGTRRGGVLRTIRDPGFLDNMVNRYAMNLDDVADLTDAGLSALGAQFKTEDIAAAGRAYDTGMVRSREEYMGMRGAISGLGGTERELERIMKSAVAAGMDSSKNVTDMVNAIGNAAAASGAGGYSVFGGAATGISATIQALLGAGVSANMAPSAAANIAAMQDRFTKERGATIPDMILSYGMATAGMSPGLPGSESVATMTAAEGRELLAMLDKDGEGALKNIRNRGFRQLVGKDAEETRKNIIAQSTRILESGINKAYGGWAYGGEYEEARKKMLDMAKRQAAGETISQKEFDEVNPFWAEVLRTRGFAATPFEGFLAHGTITNKPAEEALGSNTSFDYEKYKRAIEKMESSGNPTARPIDRKTGLPASTAFGKYQFIRGTANSLGMSYDKMVSLGGSAEGLAYQDEMMRRSTDENAKQIADLRKVPGARLLTDEELLAGMHHAGPAAFKEYLKSGLDDTRNSVNQGIGHFLSTFRKHRYSEEGNAPTDPGRGADQSAGLAQLTEFKKGMESVNGELGKLVAHMQAQAKTLDPENFKPLRDASGDLRDSVSALATVVTALNLRIQGDEVGAMRELGKLNKQSNKQQQKPETK